VLSTDAAVQPDLVVSALPAGFYILQINGLDMSNAAWLRIPYYEICDPTEGCGKCVYPNCGESFCPRTIDTGRTTSRKC